MSISDQTARHNWNAPAVLCCRTSAGSVIGPEHLEDPRLFAELQAGGLLVLPEAVLTLREALGAKLRRTVEAYTALTPELVTPLSVSSCPRQEPGTDQRILRRLQQRWFAVKQVLISDRTHWQDGTLYIRQGLCEEARQVDALVTSVEISVIPPEGRRVATNTILDVIPVATKVEGQLGNGLTHGLEGLVVLLTGADAAGAQLHEFGSSQGCLAESIRFDRPGCPDAGDLIVRVDVRIQVGAAMERGGPLAAHKACDRVVQEFREVLRDAEPTSAVKLFTHHDIRRPGRPRVLLVKVVMGQGAMHEKLLLPAEPAGVAGGRTNIEMGNLPVVLSTNELRDGAVHALTCVGPASKETSRHYMREPLMELLDGDDGIDFLGIVLIGSPQSNDDKTYGATRLGALVELLDLDGAIVTTEGFGNNHIDFACCIEQIGSRDIPVVGMTYAADQGRLVLGNQSMNALVELNKNAQGRESQILGENTLCRADACRALAMLKARLAGVAITPAPLRWSAEVIAANQSRAEGITGLQSEIPMPSAPPPLFTPLAKTLRDSVVALCTAGGVHLVSQTPYVLAGDCSFREIPSSTLASQLMVSHGGFDNSDVNRDINAMFPLERLRELADEGLIGAIAPTHIGFMGGGGDVERFRQETGPAIARLLRQQGVDVAVFTGGCGTCHRSAVIVQRAVEAAGIATVIIAALPPIARQEGAPRITAPHLPIGANAGEPGNRLMQRGILLDSLRAIEQMKHFGEIKPLPYVYRRETTASPSDNRI